MENRRITNIYFSPGGTTQKISTALAKHLSDEAEEINLLTHPLTEQTEKEIPQDNVLIAAVPVYAGRVPELVAKQLKYLKGQKGPAVAIVVYGNREYDDALIELRDLLDENGFIVCAGAAFIARHSIFPEVAAQRPDQADMELIRAFAEEIRGIVNLSPKQMLSTSLPVKGNRPYRNTGVIPLHPKGDRHCTKCGKCAGICPKQAIDPQSPKKTDKKRCISCSACIHICPEHSRAFRGMIYNKVNQKFRSNCAERKEPEFFWPDRG